VVTLVAATFGDLVESLLKRSVGVKDSGTIMPGHGGFLDRLDAILVAIPFAVFTIWMVDQIQNLMLVVNYLKS
jgi:phosphatidate cytidylyltransferase